MGISGGNSCHCKTTSKDTNLLAPLRGKMKVLKKIKRRMGLVPRSSSGSNIGTNNLPPLLFHQVHGDNIRLSRDGTIAKRVESFCKGITFSARPVKINEKVCIKFIEISNNWNGVIRFGFTYNNPADNVRSLPKYACPDLTNKPGYWAKALAERFCERDTVLFYYVTSSGEVHFGINGEEKGVFFSGVETRGPLWALIDVYGNSTAIQFIDVRQNHLNNSSRKNYIPSNTNSNSCDNTPEDIDRLIVPMQAMHIQHQQGNNNPHNATNEDRDVSLLPLRNQPQGLIFHPVPFHRTRGRNVRFSSDRCIASRNDAEFCQGYVFTARPIQLGERFVVQILATETMYVGALALGLTSCDPATLQQPDLPDDSDLLLDRPEYWVVSKDVASSPQRGDELNFCVTLNGEVQISKNGGSPTVVMHVDQTLKLWAFLDIYGSTQKIRVLSSPPQQHPSSVSVSPVRIMNPERQSSRCNISSESTNNINGQTEARRNSNNSGAVPAVPVAVPVPAPNSSRVCCVSPNDVQFQSGAAGGAVIVVNLPPSHANLLNHQQQNTNSNNSNVIASGSVSHSHSQNSISIPSQSNIVHHHSSHSSIPQAQVAQPMIATSPSPQPISCSSVVPGASAAVLPSNSAVVPSSSTGTMLSTYSSTYIEPISSGNNSIYNTIKGRSDLTLGLSSSGVECTICYENPIDSVLYMCGHMCMCYNCAVQQWRGKGGGHCPLCRAVIRDVIRTYKS